MWGYGFRGLSVVCLMEIRSERDIYTFRARHELFADIHKADYIVGQSAVHEGFEGPWQYELR